MSDNKNYFIYQILILIPRIIDKDGVQDKVEGVMLIFIYTYRPKGVTRVTRALGKLSYYQCIVHRGETNGMYI